ncbi:MAG TPA: tyrosine-type recombinase/integrase [Nitrospiraceae bacterium]|nr:tyrosine-type recombinase/integrase [Nitrospiraceae bacterium]
MFELLAAKQAASKRKSGLVFTTRQGAQLQARYVLRTFTKARERVGLPDFRFHDLRHTFATRLVQKGVDLYKVQRLLGHKTGVRTQRYAHHSPESLRDGVRVLEEDRPVRVSTNLAQWARVTGSEAARNRGTH